MDLLDGEVEISARDALDAGEARHRPLIVRRLDAIFPSSLYAVAAASLDGRVLAAIAIHPNTAPSWLQPVTGCGAFGHPRPPRYRRPCSAIGETGLDYFRHR